jgi:hypothetical protein
MPRPTSKTQLLEQARTGYAKLQADLTPLSPAEMTAPDMVGPWSIKDVLAHLLAWQHMVRDWYLAGKRGETPATPSEQYTWREIPALNQAIYETHRDRPLADVQAEFEASHQEIVELMEAMSNDELFTPQVYAWTKSTTLGSYFTSATSSHYEWARKEIRKGLKAQRK